MGGVEKCSAGIFLKEHTCVSRGALAGNCLVFNVLHSVRFITEIKGC